MSSADDARQHYVDRHAAFVRTLRDDSAWAARRRTAAIATFADVGIPDTKREEWRYTNVAPIAKARYEIAPPPAHTVDRTDLESHAFPVFACSVYVFVNGRFAPALSAPSSLPGGARVESLAALSDAAEAVVVDRFGALLDLKQNGFAALNQAFFQDGALVHAPRGAEAGQPIHLVFVSAPTDEPAVVHPRVLIHAEAGSHVSIIQDHVSVGNAAGFTNPATEIYIDANASVDYVMLQRETDHRFHVSNLAVLQQRASRLSCHTLTLGGAIVRNDAAVVLADEGAECGLNGLFLGGGRQLLDNHTLVDHAMPHCTSRELYKGVLGGGARGVFRGRVIVRPGAQKTAASQSNRNLLLGGRAEIDTKPQLEIYADDVKCSHGTTIGQLDNDALFYLRTRGISLHDARDMLTRAFCLEILDALPARALGQALDELVLERLRGARAEVEAP